MTIDAAPVHHLELVPMGDSAWRLFDHAREHLDDEHGRLIAYVERQTSGMYETVWVAHGRGVDQFDSLEAVLVAAARRMATAVSTHSKPVPIPHRRPLSLR